MASFDKMNFLNPPVLNVALDPESENDMYIIKGILDSLMELIAVTDSTYVLSKLARDLATVCDYILEAEGKKKS